MRSASWGKPLLRVVCPSVSPCFSPPFLFSFLAPSSLSSWNYQFFFPFSIFSNPETHSRLDDRPVQTPYVPTRQHAERSLLTESLLCHPGELKKSLVNKDGTLCLMDGGHCQEGAVVLVIDFDFE